MTGELNNWTGFSDRAKEQKTKYKKALYVYYALSGKNGSYLNLTEDIKWSMRLSLQKMDERF